MTQFRSVPSLLAGLLLFATVTLQTQLASAAVDTSECPAADGTYKQNGKEPFKISATIQRGVAVYDIGDARYFADGLDHKMTDGKTPYIATCKRGTLYVTVDPKGRKKTLELSRFDATGSLALETETKKDVADQVLVNVDKLQDVPAHQLSECPAHRTGMYINPRADSVPRGDLKRVSTFFDDGNYILELGQMWRIDGTQRDMGNGVTYSGSCSKGIIYISIFHDGAFKILRTYINAGGQGSIYVVNYDVRPGWSTSTYSYRLPEQPEKEESKGSYSEQFPDDDDN